MKAFLQHHTSRKIKRAFTLIELLVVIAIISILTTIAVIGVAKVFGSGTLTNSATTITNLLDQARAYAMANNTYVVVGFTEVAANSFTTANQTLATGIGCVIAEVVATQDGSNPANSSNTGANLVAISKPYVFNNLHLADLSAVTSGNMARTTPTINLTASGTTTATPSNWPEGSFSGIFIQFDPQGTARQVTSFSTGTEAAIVPLMELGLQASHGAQTSTTDINYAALQIEGVTGANHLYRP